MEAGRRAGSLSGSMLNQNGGGNSLKGRTAAQHIKSSAGGGGSMQGRRGGNDRHHGSHRRSTRRRAGAVPLCMCTRRASSLATGTHCHYHGSSSLTMRMCRWGPSGATQSSSGLAATTRTSDTIQETPGFLSALQTVAAAHGSSGNQNLAQSQLG
jgi:hypothetical protein